MMDSSKQYNFTTKYCKKVQLISAAGFQAHDFLNTSLPLDQSWSYKQILSVNLRYAHLRALLLIAILEQPMRMLKIKHCINLCWKYL